jgi:hypothetical protein
MKEMKKFGRLFSSQCMQLNISKILTFALWIVEEKNQLSSSLSSNYSAQQFSMDR